MISPGQKRLPRNSSKIPTVLVDRCLPPSFVKALQKFGVQNAYHLSDVYPDGGEQTEDLEWIKDAGEMGYVVLTRDRRVEKNSLEYQLIEKYGAKVFTITARSASKDTIGLYFGRQLHNILRRAKRSGPAFWSVRGYEPPRKPLP